MTKFYPNYFLSSDKISIFAVFNIKLENAGRELA